MTNEVNAHSAWRSLPLSLDAFGDVWDAIFALAGETPQTKVAMLACDEWVANVVAYSGATRFSFQCARDADSLCIAFSDDGVPFDPTADRGDSLPDFENQDLGGMGLGLIRQTASKMRYRREGSLNILELRFPLSPTQ